MATPRKTIVILGMKGKIPSYLNLSATNYIEPKSSVEVRGKKFAGWIIIGHENDLSRVEQQCLAFLKNNHPEFNP